jgi:hypothetical protein
MDRTAMYTIESNYNSCYGHAFKKRQTEELLRFDCIVIRYGVKGGRKGAIYRHWKDGADFCEYVTKAQNHTRLLQIKHTNNINLNSTTAKRGQEGYDPDYKYDYIYDTVIKNVSYFTEYADQDLCGDKKKLGPRWLW